MVFFLTVSPPVVLPAEVLEGGTGAVAEASLVRARLRGSLVAETGVLELDVFNHASLILCAIVLAIMNVRRTQTTVKVPSVDVSPSLMTF